jgi:2-dehydro-3-deoxyphosphooctonate aldolase (KDO 8-P synthase)
MKYPLFSKLPTKKPTAQRQIPSPVSAILKRLEVIKYWRFKLDMPTTTDIHTEAEARMAAVMLMCCKSRLFYAGKQSFCRLLPEPGKVVNIKKGQFVSAISMAYAAEKVSAAGNDHIMLTERGSMFGYHDLVVDFRNIPIMKSFGYPVILDATHSLQQPNQTAGVTGGLPEMIETIAAAGIAAGVDGLFIETHPDPPSAKI